MFIDCENIQINDSLGPKFTAYGAFGVTFVLGTSGDRVDFEWPRNKDGARLMPVVTCELRKMSDNTVHATGVPAVNATAGRWQADFTGVAAASGLKLVYSITDGVAAPVFGPEITNLTVKAALEINSSNVPAPGGALGSTRSFDPVGDFKLDPFTIQGFESVIVVQGEVLSRFGLGALRVFNVAKTYELRFTHSFFQDAGLTASHAVRVKGGDGKWRTASRPGL